MWARSLPFALRMRSRLRGDEPRIRAVLPIRLAAFSDPDYGAIRGLIAIRLAALALPIVPPIRCPEVRRIPCGCVVAWCQAGWCGALGGQFVGVSFYGASGTGRKVDTSSPIGSCGYTVGSLLVTTENKAVAGRRELMGSRQALQGALRVNVLIGRGLHVDADRGRCQRLCCCWVCISALSGVCAVVD